MRQTHARRPLGLTGLAGALPLALSLFAGECSASSHPLGPEQPRAVMSSAPEVPAASLSTESGRVRLAGGFGITIGVGGLGLSAGPNYCSQPGYCYPAPQVVEEVVEPRRIKRRTTAPSKVAAKGRKARVAKAAAPKQRLVRSIAASPEPVSDTGAPFAFGNTSRGVGPGTVGDSTGGGRITPFRVPGGGGGGPVMGDRSGGGRMTPMFRRR